MGTPLERLRAFVDELAADGSLSDEDLERIAAATAAESARVQAEHDWRASAHVHNASHADTKKTTKMVCCDCRRGLISDMGTERILVCPKLHGRRPPELRPTSDNGAVECGQPDE